MNTVALIVDGPITPGVEAAALAGAGGGGAALVGDGAVGAVLRFEGVVRRIEDGRALQGLEYQTYDQMARQELEALARSIGQRHALSSIVALHSRGRVGVGEASFVLEVMAPHRAEAIAAVDEFINRLKRDVPIWKRPVWINDTGSGQ